MLIPDGKVVEGGERPNDVVEWNSKEISCYATTHINQSAVFCNRQNGHRGPHWTHFARRPFYWTGKS